MKTEGSQIGWFRDADEQLALYEAMYKAGIVEAVLPALAISSMRYDGQNAKVPDWALEASLSLLRAFFEGRRFRKTKTTYKGNSVTKKRMRQRMARWMTAHTNIETHGMKKEDAFFEAAEFLREVRGIKGDADQVRKDYYEVQKDLSTPETAIPYLHLQKTDLDIEMPPESVLYAED